MNPHGVHMRQLQVQRKMLNSEDWTAALMVKSRQWRDPGKHRGPNYIPESLEAKLQATLNMIPAYTRYAAPLTALTLMNDKELRRTSDSLTAAMADGTCRNAPAFPLSFSSFEK